MDKALNQLRQYEKDVWVRNRDRRQIDQHDEDTRAQEEQLAKDVVDLKAWRASCTCNQPRTSWTSLIGGYAYTLYTWMFYCRRNTMNALFHDESRERQKMIIEIPLPKHPWMCISGIVEDMEYDVTEDVNGKLSFGERLTPEWLFTNTDLPEVETPDDVTWEYIDSLTFEVHKITSDGVVNEVKPKTD